jgi:hypothetical protein
MLREWIKSRVGPIRNDMRIGERRDACQVCGGNGLATCPELGEDLSHAHGIPDEHRVGEQAQTADFVPNLLIVTGAKHFLIRKEEPTRESMAGFPRLSCNWTRPLSVGSCMSRRM